MKPQMKRKYTSCPQMPSAQCMGLVLIRGISKKSYEDFMKQQSRKILLKIIALFK